MNNPDQTSHAKAKTLETRIWELLGQKKVDQAIAVCQELNRNHPQFGSGWHTASQLAMKDISLNTIRELLGHSDLQMTMRYAHLAPNIKASAVELLVR